MSDLHVNVLRRVARQARARLTAHRSATAAPATEQEAGVDRALEEAATAADDRLAESMKRRRRPAAGEQSVAELDALAAHARHRLALQRRRVLLGRGGDTKLAELERATAGAEGRALRARRGLTSHTRSDSPREDTP